MKCLRCEAENPPGTRFCGQCATALAAVCPSCGAGNPLENKFCGQCAAPLGKPAQPRFAAPQSYTPRHLAERILTSKSSLEEGRAKRGPRSKGARRQAGDNRETARRSRQARIARTARSIGAGGISSPVERSPACTGPWTTMAPSLATLTGAATRCATPGSRRQAYDERLGDTLGGTVRHGELPGQTAT